jgi:hypothetical protein
LCGVVMQVDNLPDCAVFVLDFQTQSHDTARN